MGAAIHGGLQERLEAGIARVYRETMATAPQGVEVCLGREVLAALLRECACPAEKALWPREEGSRLLQDYHAACACELFPSIHGLVRETLGRELRHVWLRAVPDTRDKLLVLILATTSDAPGEDA